MNDKLKKALAEIEKDNVAELKGGESDHRFSRSFDRRALALCRSKPAGNSVGGVRRKRIPIWAAAVIALIICGLVTGCAVAVYNYLTRYIPGYGITDVRSDVLLYASEEEFSLGDMQIETVLYVGGGDGGKLYLWAKGPSMGGWDNTEWMNKPLFSAKSGGKESPVYAVSSSERDSVGEYQCEAENVMLGEDMVLVRGSASAEVKLTDQTDRGYSVKKWGEYDSVTVKILPLYADNRILFMETDGLPDSAKVSATVTMYDSLGNKVRSGSGSLGTDGYLMKMPHSLPGEIVKIEVNSLRVQYHASSETVELMLPQKDGSVECDIVLLDNEVFTETAVNISRKGNKVTLTTKIDAHKYRPLTDVAVIYESRDALENDYSTSGFDTVIYSFTLNEDAEKLSLTPVWYSYIIRNGDEALCSIEIE